jgi:hypothetical protein
VNIACVPCLSRNPKNALDPLWDIIPEISIDSFHPRSSTHRPIANVRVGHREDRLHIRFSVHDCFVLSRTTKTNGPVWKDSCVECFIEPISGLGYFNLEFNAGGTMHCSHITNHERTDDGFAAYATLDESELSDVVIDSTLPNLIETEICMPTNWSLYADIPVSLFAKRLARIPSIPGKWRGNFYKCADDTSHPHWASWSPIGDDLNFHAPHLFGTLQLK